MSTFESFDERARDEKKELDALEVHNANLHDEAFHDEATGKTNMNDEVGGNDETTNVVELHQEDKSEDVLGSLAPEEDAAAKWLRENDPDQRKAA